MHSAESLESLKRYKLQCRRVQGLQAASRGVTGPDELCAQTQDCTKQFLHCTCTPFYMIDNQLLVKTERSEVK